MSNYLVTLKPLDTFFFSQESKYRLKKEENGKKSYQAEYFQRSAYFPQQTAVLGMLRYHVLQINGQIPIQNKETANTLIGKKSFGINGDNNFGKIHSLSPVFIIKDKKFYIPNPKDLILNDKLVYMEYEKKSGIKTNFVNADEFLFLKDYKEKNGLSNFLINVADKEDNLLYEYDGDKENKKDYVFISEERIGIKKNKKGKAKKEAFYKQIVYKMKDDSAFGFYAEIDEEQETLSKFKTIFMGTEKTPFSITFERKGENLIDLIRIGNVNSPKIVLISDTFFEGDIYKDSLFAITETKPFRFLETKVIEDPKYYSTNPLAKSGNNGEENIKRSNRFNLIKRGSVFYFENESKMNSFAEKIENQKNFYKIGYNYFKKI